MVHTDKGNRYLKQSENKQPRANFMYVCEVEHLINTTPWKLLLLALVYSHSNKLEIHDGYEPGPREAHLD